MYNVIMQDLYRLIWLSRPLMQRAEALVEANLAGTGISVRMRAVLEMLAHRPASVPELAQRLEIKRQYVQVMVNEVMAAGYAEKRANPRHRASPLIALTEPGVTLMDDILAKERGVLERLATGVSDAELAMALSVVERVMTSIDTELGGDPE